MKNTGASSIVCFTILVLPVLLDEEYWSFQYRVFYNTSITSIVNARYWSIQYCICTILVLPVLEHYNTGISSIVQIYNTGNTSIVNITILVFPVL